MFGLEDELHGKILALEISLARYKKANKQLQKAVCRKNKLIYRLRYDNPHYRRWCRYYGTAPKLNPWIKNFGLLPSKMHSQAYIDIKQNDGRIQKRVYAHGACWDCMGLPYNIDEWRFHNGMAEK